MGKINYKDSTLLLLRVAIALIFIYHGSQKLMNASGTMSFFTSLGLPGWAGVIIGIIEVVAGLLVLSGFYYKWANYVLALVMVGALILVQIPGVFKSGAIGAGFERDVLILITTLVLASNGPGHFSIHKK